MILRAAIAAAALAAAVLALVRHGDAQACQRAQVDAYQVVLGHRDAPDTARRLRDRCRGGDPLAAAASVLRRAQPALAEGLAREATRREPDNARAWTALALVLAPQDPAGARAAQAHARRLNPFAPAAAP